MSGSRDTEYTEYVAARLPSLRRLAAVLCGDWQRADDLVQSTLAKLYVHWRRVRAADHADAYARSVLVHEFIHERRSGWARRVSLSGQVIDRPAAAVDQDAVLDLRAAVAALPARQRATLVLRFYCDLNVDQSAAVLGCSPGTVKSQTARALDSVRRALGRRWTPAPPGRPPGPRSTRSTGGAPAMIEQQIRDLFAETAGREPPAPAQVDLQAARRRGRAMLRWRRAGLAGASVLVAALVATLVVVVPAGPAPPRGHRAGCAAPLQPAGHQPVVRLAAARSVDPAGRLPAHGGVRAGGQGVRAHRSAGASRYTPGGGATSPARPRR